MMIARACGRSSAAPTTMNAPACPTPRCTHFISVSLRVLALISVVCGLLQHAAMISYTIPADTRKATPSDPPLICDVLNSSSLSSYERDVVRTADRLTVSADRDNVSNIRVTSL